MARPKVSDPVSSAAAALNGLASALQCGKVVPINPHMRSLLDTPEGTLAIAKAILKGGAPKSPRKGLKKALRAL